MAIVFVASGLLGIVVGMRFRVYALVPVTLLSMLFTAAVVPLAGIGGISLFATLAITFIGVQFGYVCGSFGASLKEQPVLRSQSAEPRRFGLPAK